MNITRVGVDIAKNVFHVHAVDRHDQCQWQAKLKRAEWLAALAEHVPAGATIAMEACASSHHWGRELQRRGYLVRLIGAQFVKPYVKSHENDRVDAEAICEAAGRPSMRFVARARQRHRDRALGGDRRRPRRQGVESVGRAAGEPAATRRRERKRSRG